MNIEKFWNIIKSLGKLNDKEYSEVHGLDDEKDAFDNVNQKYDKILHKYCQSSDDFKMFISIYERYYEILYQKYYKEYLHGEKGLINMAEDTYEVFITFLIILGEETVKNLLTLPIEEVIQYKTFFKCNYTCNDLHAYFNNLKLTKVGLVKDKFGKLYYKKNQLPVEIKKEIEMT